MRKTGKQKAKTSRPVPRADLQEHKDMVVESALVQCDDAHIAQLINVSVEELQEAFGPLVNKMRALGKKKIKMALFNLATCEVNKSTPALIWATKQYLGMVEPEKKEGDDAVAEIEIVSYARPKK